MAKKAENLQERVASNRGEETLPLRTFRDYSLFSFDENGYYVNETHPLAARIMNAYIRLGRFFTGQKDIRT